MFGEVIILKVHSGATLPYTVESQCSGHLSFVSSYKSGMNYVPPPQLSSCCCAVYIQPISVFSEVSIAAFEPCGIRFHIHLYSMYIIKNKLSCFCMLFDMRSCGYYWYSISSWNHIVTHIENVFQCSWFCHLWSFYQSKLVTDMNIVWFFFSLEVSRKCLNYCFQHYYIYTARPWMLILAIYSNRFDHLMYIRDVNLYSDNWWPPTCLG
jgi:hypothetical protein